MHRALTILKYLPAVLCGLLVVAWVGSIFSEFGVRYGSIAEAEYSVGSVVVFHNSNGASSKGWQFYAKPVERPPGFRHTPTPVSHWLGAMSLGHEITFLFFMFPIPALLTLLLPLAIGPFNRFRFPLWSWFVFTALVAVELAYYLQ